MIQVGFGAAAGGLIAAALLLSAPLLLSVPGERISAWGVAAAIAYGLVLLLVCVLACSVPTRQALRIEPSEALRAES